MLPVANIDIRYIRRVEIALNSIYSKELDKQLCGRPKRWLETGMTTRTTLHLEVLRNRALQINIYLLTY